MTIPQTVFAFSVLGLLFLTLITIFLIAQRIDVEFMSFAELKERRRQRWAHVRDFVIFCIGSALSQALGSLIMPAGLRDVDRQKIRFAIFGLYVGVYMVKQLMDLREPLNLISLRETPAEKAARMLANLAGVTIKISASTENATAALNRVGDALTNLKRKVGR